MEKRHPMQPVVDDGQGVRRFKANAIVRHLLDHGPFDMNSIAGANFSQEDMTQFAQLIGYSICGFQELSYVSDDDADLARAADAADADPDAELRLRVLEGKLEEAREHARDLATTLFNIHPDDLQP